MVAGAGIEGERKILSATVVRAIQSIKEVVKNHSDADIYVVLQETNMDPNETAQKLLNQDPFHEVRRKRDKKKDARMSQNTGYRGLTEARKPVERVGQQIMKSNPIDLGVPRGGYKRNTVAGGSREFRVVRDNRSNKNMSREVKPPSPQNPTSTSEQRSSQVSEKGSHVCKNVISWRKKILLTPPDLMFCALSSSSTAANQKPSGGNHQSRQVVQTGSHTVVPPAQRLKPNDSNQSVVGVYSSSSDPVHVPSPESRSAANVGAIKRELGAVGVRRVPSSAQNNIISNLNIGKDVSSSSRETLKSSNVNIKADQPESALPSVSVSRPSSSNQYNSRSHQQVAGHQKASQPAKEWKRKSGPKSNTKGNGVIGSLGKSISQPANSSQGLEIDTTHVQDKFSQVDINENQNVFIAEHIRVSESDRSRLTFGSFGAAVDSSRAAETESLAAGSGEIPSSGAPISLSESKPESPTVQDSASKDVVILDDQVRNSGSQNTLASGGLSENIVSNNKNISSSQTLDGYDEIGLVHEDSPSFTQTESQQQPNPPELASFLVYGSQAGYDYFRPSMDEPSRGQGLPLPQEALGSHMTNIPISSIPMVQQQQQQQQHQQQQQQPPMPQLYQQLHVSPFPNLMPYRQFLSPVYGPAIPMAGYSSNPNYPPHPSNGNSFLLMPGGSSNNLKYGFKPVPGGGPTGFGNFASPTGYAVNAPGGVVGGLEDPSRLKYKDGNLYRPNPQAETSEMWIQNPREIPNLQSPSYYNMAGQASPHGAYMPPPLSAHQSSHMQFPGLYRPPPPPQAAGMANSHHLGPAMGGGGGVNIGMAAAGGAAPGGQVGAYQQQQQPQMGHLNWNPNF